MQRLLLVECKLMIHLSRMKQIRLKAECSVDPVDVLHKLDHAMPKRAHSVCANSSDLVAVHGVTSHMSATVGMCSVGS